MGSVLGYKRMYIYRELFWGRFGRNILKVGRIGGLPHGFIPIVRARGDFTEVGCEFEPSGLQECSSGMKPLNLGEFGRLWAAKRPLEVSLKA